MIFFEMSPLATAVVTIGNLKSTTEKNQEPDWLKTNVARFTQMLQGQRDPMTVSNMILSELAPRVNAEHGVTARVSVMLLIVDPPSSPYK